MLSSTATCANSFGRYREAAELYEDFVGGLGPDEGFGVTVVIGDVSTDRLLKVANRLESNPRRMRWRVMTEKKFQRALSQEPDVGVKWKIQRG